MEIEISNVPDFKINGKWVKTKRIDGIRHRTRAYVVWCGVVERTIENGPYQTNNPSYKGMINGFEDFYHFTDWCQEQVGYMNKSDTGACRFWSLDKDIIKINNKIYGPEYCSFVPQQINNMLIFRQRQAPHRVKDNLPIGVSYHKLTSKYQAEVSNGENSIYLGLFQDPFEGHKAWQEAKVDQMDNCIKTYEGQVSDKVIEGLFAHRNLILDDLNNGKETIRFH